MKTCQNCGSTNEQDALACTTCSMKGMLVEAAENSKKHSTIKKIYHSCINCGTTEIGDGGSCKKCNFPISNISSKQNLHNPKIKRS